MATEAEATAGDALDPADVLGDLESLDALDAEIARVRMREERRLVRLACQAGYFHKRMKNEEILGLFREHFLNEPKRPSRLARLEARREARYSGRAPGTPGARRCSAGSWSPSAGASRTSMRPWCPTSGNSCGRTATRRSGQGTSKRCPRFSLIQRTRASRPRPGTRKKARTARTRRLILLGAWVLARRETLTELRDLVSAELAGFLEQGQRVDRHKALLKDVLDQGVSALPSHRRACPSRHGERQIGNRRTAEQERARYWRRRHRDQCVRCGEPAERGHSMCARHLALESRNNVKRRAFVR